MTTSIRKPMTQAQVAELAKDKAVPDSKTGSHFQKLISAVEQAHARYEETKLAYEKCKEVYERAGDRLKDARAAVKEFVHEQMSKADPATKES